MKPILLSDFSIEDSISGGSELVDYTLSKELNVDIIKCKDWTPTDKQFLIVSNISTLPQQHINFIIDRCEYIILEHDYKIHWTRHPWKFKDSIIPTKERINYGLYNNAKAVFVQTDDHLQVFKDNDVSGNFISLKASIWSELELGRFSSLQNNKKTYKFAIVGSSNWIKNQNGAEVFCKTNKLDYEIISSQSYNEFIEKLSEYPALVFFPIARESCCRLLVEARCMNMNVLTNNNSGAFKSEWFTKSGGGLVSFLRECSKNNISKIKQFI